MGLLTLQQRPDSPPPMWHLRLVTRVVGCALVSCIVATAVGAQPMPSKEELQKSLRTYCELRMSELESQEQKNLAAIQWQQDGTGAHGDYVGYDPDYACTVSPGDNAVPTGRLQYREIHFEKRGTSIDDAMRAAPAPVKFEDVTQVFAYRRGVWE